MTTLKSFRFRLLPVSSLLIVITEMVNVSAVQPTIELWMFCDFVLGLNFISLCFWIWYCMVMSLKQGK